jgi:hypothetical protein
VTFTQVYIIERRLQPRRQSISVTSAGIEIILLFNNACAGREVHHPGWPQNHGVSAAQDRADMAPAARQRRLPALYQPELSRRLGRTISAPLTACVAAWPALTSWKSS